MMRTIALTGLLLATAIAFGGVAEDTLHVNLVDDAQAICDDGDITGPCSCPHIGLPGKEPIVPIQC